MALRVARIPAVFLLSIPVALASALLASYFWILIAVLGLALDRFARPAQEQEEEGETAGPGGLTRLDRGPAARMINTA